MAFLDFLRHLRRESETDQLRQPADAAIPIAGLQGRRDVLTTLLDDASFLDALRKFADNRRQG